MPLNQLLGQYHLADGAALHYGLGEQMAGQLHLTEHAHLRISRFALPGLGFGEGRRVLGGIGGTPHHPVDGQQLQTGPAGVVGLQMPAGSRLVKQALDAFIPELLAGL